MNAGSGAIEGAVPQADDVTANNNFPGRGRNGARAARDQRAYEEENR